MTTHLRSPQEFGLFGLACQLLLRSKSQSQFMYNGSKTRQDFGHDTRTGMFSTVAKQEVSYVKAAYKSDEQKRQYNRQPAKTSTKHWYLFQHVHNLLVLGHCVQSNVVLYVWTCIIVCKQGNDQNSNCWLDLSLSMVG